MIALVLRCRSKVRVGTYICSGMGAAALLCGFLFPTATLPQTSNPPNAATASQTGQLKPPYPQVDRSFQSKYCKIEYTSDKEPDARQLATDVDDSLDRMSRDLAPLDPHLMENFDCTIVQFSKPVLDKASAAQELTESENWGSSFRIFLIALSSIPSTSRTLVGEPKDEDFSHKTIADELSGVLFERIVHAKGAGWTFRQMPDWFLQGIEGYTAVMHSTPHEQAVTLPKYVAAVRAKPGEVSFSGGIHVGNPYLGGFVLVTFLYDVYGAERVNALLISTKPTFDESFTDAFGDLHTFETKYDAWIENRLSYGVRSP